MPCERRPCAHLRPLAILRNCYRQPGDQPMNWRIKAVVQKTLSVLPGGMAVNDMLQQTLGDLRHFGEHVARRVDDWAIFADHMRQLGRSPAGLNYLEIGAGWMPILPVCFSLAGAARCWAFDLNRHMKAHLAFRMLGRLEQFLPEIARAAGRPEPEVNHAYRRLREAVSIQDLLARASIAYSAPADASATGLPAASVDVVFSNAVLEHVPGDAIRAMMRETRRVLRPGGLAVHSVNCGDHFAYTDRNVTPINYLRYPERRWRLWNNRILYQNRLRPSDFLDMATAAGLTVVLERWRPRADLLEALPGLKIDAAFRHYPPEQLCCTSLDFAARRD